MASNDYPYPWSAPPITRKKGWWGNAKKAFLRPWKNREHATSLEDPKQQGKRKKTDKSVPQKKRSADQLQYMPRTQEEDYRPYSTPQIPVFVPRFTNLSPFNTQEDAESDASSADSSHSLTGEFEIKQDDKPVRPLLSNIFPMYDSPTVTAQKPEAKEVSSQEQSRRYLSRTAKAEESTTLATEYLPSVQSTSSSGRSAEQQQRKASDDSNCRQKTESTSSSSESTSSAEELEITSSGNKQREALHRRGSPIHGSRTGYPERPESHWKQELSRRHSTGTAEVETTPSTRPSSAQSTSSSQRSLDRRQRRSSAIRALPVLPRRHSADERQRRFPSPPDPIQEETDSDSPMEFGPARPYYHPRPPSRHNYAYQPWPPDNVEDVFSPEVYNKLQSPTSSEQKRGAFKGVGRWRKGKGKGKKEEEEEEDGDIRGFDSFMMY